MWGTDPPMDPSLAAPTPTDSEGKM